MSRPLFVHRCWPIPLSAPVVELLEAAYRQPVRAYHHAGHVDEVLHWMDWAHARSPWIQPREVCVAVLFHDAVYVAGARDNEQRSAELACRAIADHSEFEGVDRERVTQLIEWTAHHGRLDPGDVDAEAARFLDCDLAILSAAPARYQRYCAEIAEEYRALPATVYRTGRRVFVTELLARPQIYLSALFHDAFEAIARSNLRIEADGRQEHRPV
jgi:predicted metal-dependent HD superfamily phosphohydrolase